MKEGSGSFSQPSLVGEAHPRGGMGRLKPVNQRRNDALTRVAWDQLETLLAIHYRSLGYQVEHVGTGATGAQFDGGIDLKLRREDEYIVVQCKHWNAMKVTHNAVHELLGIMVNQSATGAILVTSGEFTNAAIAAATRQGHVQLIDGDELRKMLGPLPEATAPPPISLLTSGQRSRAVASSSGSWMWWVLALVGLVVFVVIIRALLERTAWSAGNVQDVVQSAPVDTPKSLNDPGQAALEPPRQPQRELTDWHTGTTIGDLPPGAPRPRQPTAAELRESQRKADEAMKVLESSTPEMQVSE